MRVPIAYYMMLLYVTVMFKPLVPIVSDVISHTFSEAIHIATVHAIYGSTHLEKELSDTSENANDKHSGSTNEASQVPVHVSTTESHHDCSLYKISADYPFLKLCVIKPGFILQNFLPPRFC